jgi:hypothetical protein
MFVMLLLVTFHQPHLRAFIGRLQTANLQLGLAQDGTTLNLLFFVGRALQSHLSIGVWSSANVTKYIPSLRILLWVEL